VSRTRRAEPTPFRVATAPAAHQRPIAPTRRALPVDLDGFGALEDRHTALEQDARRAAREQPPVDGRRTGMNAPSRKTGERTRAATSGRRSRHVAIGQTVLRSASTASSQRRPGAWRRAHGQRARLRVPGIDRHARAEAPDLVDCRSIASPIAERPGP
jgi:hypothetical protein